MAIALRDGENRPTGEMSQEGRVLQLWCRDSFDHDYASLMARVWNVEDQEPREVCYGWTLGNHDSYSTVDATREVREQYAQWYYKKLRLEALENNLSRAHRLEIGKRVTFRRTFNGRKQGRVDDGAQGVLFYIGSNPYGDGARYGVTLDDGRSVFVGDGILNVADPENYLRPIDEIEADVMANARYCAGLAGL